MLSIPPVKFNSAASAMASKVAVSAADLCHTYPKATADEIYRMFIALRRGLSINSTWAQINNVKHA